MPEVRKPFVQTRRDAWIEINLAHIEHNIKVLKSYTSPEVKFLAVIKADAYGHGATMTAPIMTASGVDMFGVASVDEGIELRHAGITAPILVLGTVPVWAFASATENDIQISIFNEDHINACIKIFESTGIKPQVHVKVDTGMNRIGVCVKDTPAFVKTVFNTAEIELKGLFTHLACAECVEKSEVQQVKFRESIKDFENLNIPVHTVNTAGLINYKEMHGDMTRAGIGIYGLMPDLNPDITDKPDLKPAMGVKGRIVFLKDIEKGNGISYGHTYVTENEDAKIATIPVGYADGIPRELSNKIYGLVNGQKIPQIGNITMDQMMFDVSGINNINIGDVITLIGEDGEASIHIDEWANIIGTINYELTCRLKVRLPRIYTRD